MSQQHHSILLVDDDEDDLEILTEVLISTDKSCEIHQAHDGVEALYVLQEMGKEHHLPTLIIMDINMPKKDGKQTLLALQGDPALSWIPVVILSTSSNAMDRYFFKLRHVEMITKPYDIKVYYQLAAKLLRCCNN